MTEIPVACTLSNDDFVKPQDELKMLRKNEVSYSNQVDRLKF
jgi:hypothetical protein